MEDGGVDSTFSLEPEEMASLVTETERAWQSLGDIQYGATSSEIKSMSYRRSLYITEDMQAGDTFTKDNLRAIRPGKGLPPKFIDKLLGKKINMNTAKGTAMNWNLLKS